MLDVEAGASEADAVVSMVGVTAQQGTPMVPVEEDLVKRSQAVAVEVEVEPEPELESEPEPSVLAKTMVAEYYEALENAATKLVLVDISEQRLWAFENEEIALESPVVTGMKDRYDTQLGEYAVILKRQDYTMRGTYGRARVSYWMRFNDAYAQGLHDASWRGSDTFGGETYVTDGSHGCVNLPLDFTAELYDFVAIGTPVIVQE